MQEASDIDRSIAGQRSYRPAARRDLRNLGDEALPIWHKWLRRCPVRSQVFIACILFAATSTGTPLRGAWTGTLGKQKIAACFDGSEASYYYVAKGVDISLDETDSGTWEEVAWNKDLKPGPSTGTWQLNEPDGTRIRGVWSSPDRQRTLPIALRLAGRASSDSSCPLPGYVTPRVDAVERTPGNVKSVAGLTLRTFKALRGAVVGLELLSETPKLRPLKLALEKHNREIIEGYFECMSLPADHSDYSASLEVALVSEHWLALVESLGQDCGGPYPNWGNRAWTLERASGKPVDIAKWLKTPLVQIARKYFHWTGPEDAGEEDCAYAVKGESVDFTVWPTAKGLVFVPELPHVIAACAQPYEVPYAKLKGHLTTAGKAAIDEISRVPQSSLPAQQR